MLTSVALTNTFLYQSAFNDWYYNEFMDVTDLKSTLTTPTAVNEYFY